MNMAASLQKFIAFLMLGVALADKESCKCTSLSELQANGHLIGVTQLTYVDPTTELTYDYGLYGLEGCQAYDAELAPYCTVSGFPPSWCFRSWCWVDPSTCTNATFAESSFFPNNGLFYSYETCGEANTFVDWFSDLIPPSMTELIAVVEDYVFAIRTRLESVFDQDYQALPGSCEFNTSCDAVGNPICTECSTICGCTPEEGTQIGWAFAVDVSDTMVVFASELEAVANQPDVDNFGCMYDNLRNQWNQIAATEYTGSSRIGYQYFGAQATGAYAEWPEIEFCSTTFDPRFRPWYAAAVSGSKHIVLAIDVSGSMATAAGVVTRIELARQGTLLVLDTLTWVDHVNIILFNGGVKSQFSSDLVRATESNIQLLRNFANTQIFAGGGTNFVAPLTRAYQQLQAARNVPGRSVCTEAVLFLTDGQATFTQGNMDNIIAAENGEDVIVFSYALGSSANTVTTKLMACTTAGIFFAVTDEAELPAKMASYYNYFAELQDECKVSWVQYTGAFTGVELLSACSPIFAYDPSGVNVKELTGVTCMDLSMIVSLDQLETCGSGAYDSFVQEAEAEAFRCSGTKKIENDCQLEKLRNRLAGAGSVCVSDSCALPPQPANSSCTKPVDRFSFISISGCQLEFDECCLAGTPTPTSVPTTASPTNSPNIGTGGDENLGIVVGASVGAVIGLAAAVALGVYYKRSQAAIPFATEVRQETEGNW